MALDLTCPHCQSNQPFGQKYCRTCGKQLAAQGQPDNIRESSATENRSATAPTLRLDYSKSRGDNTHKNRNKTTLLITGLFFLIVGISLGIIIGLTRNKTNGTFTNELSANSVNNSQSSNANSIVENKKQALTVNPITSEAIVLSELVKLRFDWIMAINKGDESALDQILAVEFREISTDPPTNRKQFLEQNAQPIEIQYVNLRIEGAKLLNYDGELATLTGILKYESYQGDKIIYNSRRFASTFIKRDGNWLMVSNQTFEPTQQ